MIDKMKEVAIKQFQHQQEIIDEKNREINLLIENKNKEVSNVIQERKRSLDEKSKEVSKITQDKDREILKLSQALAVSKEELLSSKRLAENIDTKNSEMKERLEKLQKSFNEKEKQIKQIEKEMKLSEDEKGIIVAKINYEKESLLTEKNREIKILTDDYKKEFSKFQESVSNSKLELSIVSEKLDQMKTEKEILGKTKNKYHFLFIFCCSVKLDKCFTSKIQGLNSHNVHFLFTEHQLLQKENIISNLQHSLEESRKKTEFKSNLERSFESLQNQFQMKVDEIERLRKRLGLDEQRRRPSKEKKLI